MKPAPSGVEIFGYSDQAPDDILAWALHPKHMPRPSGDFTAVLRDDSGRAVSVASAPVAAFPAFATRARSGAMLVGGDVFDLAARAGHTWDWNLRAIRCMALFGHTIGSDTLHPEVHRLPEDSLVSFSGSDMDVSSLGFWDEPKKHVELEAAWRETRQALRRDTRGHPVLLSLSAGYDSRYLLAMCLADGLRPRCVTVGDPESTDVQLASEIARRHNLDHERIALTPSDYLEHGVEISRLTGGTKTAGNWHTYLYSRSAGSLSPDEVHLVGSNGEFARSFYIDRLGSLAVRAAAKLPSGSAYAYWIARLERRSRLFGGLSLVSESGPLSISGLARRATLPAEGLADSLDQFYARQRVRHFIGNGLALYAANGSPRSPFLDSKVLRAVRGLRRGDKTANAYHRGGIHEVVPSLLDLPFNAPLLGPHRSFSVFDEVLRLPATADAILDSSGLDSLVPRSQRESVLRSGTTPEIELLLTLAFAARNAP